MIKEKDENYMKLCLKLAKKGKGFVSPNPLVGAVVVKEGRIIGRGYHPRYGAPHAEVYALEEAGEDARNADLYVNLEPCAHYGKTPPCVQAIIKAGIKRVVVGMVDPNPMVNGKGIEKLREVGIEVEVGVLEEEARKLNEAYIKFITEGVPFVALKMAQSIDGKIATKTGESKWITGERARRMVHKLRSEYDAVLVGCGTILADDPSLTSHGLGRDPVRIVLDGKGKVPLSARVFRNDVKRFVFTTTYASPSWIEGLRNIGVEVIVSEGEEVDVREMLKELGKRGIASLLVEGGGETSASFLESGVVDKIFFFFAPLIIGGRDAKTSVEGKGCQNLKDAIRLKKLKIRKIGEDFLVEAYIKRCSRE
ncbi:bifunctional diaminohydroxyphosphoribosylaminopyrimidine deaminase/5-amino-6-(5-phosphoribosylamino)uracil reductase RibD [bacterium]|nr:bifunctional diaminohydroxyphosphoribosylaminopyrimidine deaminase/5-amino-6-(5-phosphoribosylamino)uracil reductase RibD [bacterium]